MNKRRISTGVGRRKQARKKARKEKKRLRNVNYKKIPVELPHSSANIQKKKVKKVYKKQRIVKTPKGSAEDSEILYFEQRLGLGKQKSTINSVKNSRRLEKELEKDGMDADFLSFLDGIGTSAVTDKNEEDEDQSIEEKESFTSANTDAIEEPKADSFIPKNDIYGQITSVRSKSRLFRNKRERNESDNFNLFRRVNGLVNRISVDNISPIVHEIESLYNSNSRSDMNTTLHRVLKAILSQPRIITNLIVPIATLLAAIASIISSDVVTAILEQLAKDSTENDTVKDNFVTFGSILCRLRVVSDKFVFSLFFWLLKSDQEDPQQTLKTILKATRVVGYKLRKDSPGQFKSLVQALQEVESSDSSFKKHLLDEVFKIKNNRKEEQKEIDEDLVRKLSKWLKTLKKDGNGVAPTEITIKDLLNADKVGRWWIVGSSWVGKEGEQRPDVFSKAPRMKGGWRSNITQILSTAEQDILNTAKKLNMNTDVRKAIFVVLFSTVDVVEAFQKIMSLKLGETQEREIIFVLVKLNQVSKKYNSFYAELIEKFCSFHQRFRFTTQLRFWDLFKNDYKGSERKIRNTSIMLAYLVAKGSLSLSILKNIEFETLATDTSLMKLLNVFFLELFDTSNDLKSILVIFRRLGKSTDFGFVKDGLILFFQNHFVNSDETTTRTAYKCVQLLEQMERKHLEFEENEEASVDTIEEEST